MEVGGLLQMCTGRCLFVSQPPPRSSVNTCGKQLVGEQGALHGARRQVWAGEIRWGYSDVSLHDNSQRPCC